MSASTLSRVALTATAITISLITCEVVARVLDLAPPLFLIPVEHYRLSDDPDMGYELAPGARTSDGIAISQQGLRDREYLVSKPEGTFRIAMIGDSVVFGFELAERDTMAKFLERLLSEATPRAGYRYEVMNFGVTGYNSRQIAREVATRVLPFHPDLIVYVYCLNDPQRYSFEFEQVLAKAHAEDRWGVRRLRTLVLRSQLYRLSKSAIWSLETGHTVNQRSGSWDDPQWRAVDTDATTAYFSSLYEPSPDWDRTKSDIKEIAALARQVGSKFVGVIVPLLKPYPGQYPLAAVHRRVAVAFESAGAPTLDLAPQIERFSRAGQFSVNIDLLHFSAAGSHFAALVILNYLFTAKLVPAADVVEFQSVHWTDPMVRTMLKWL